MAVQGSSGACGTPSEGDDARPSPSALLKACAPNPLLALQTVQATFGKTKGGKTTAKTTKKAGTTKKASSGGKISWVSLSSTAPLRRRRTPRTGLVPSQLLPAPQLCSRSPHM